MKHTMKAIVATLLLTLTSLAAQGATVTIDDGLKHGSITKAESGTKVTLTAKPDAGYFLCFDDLSVKAYVDGGSAEGRHRSAIPMYTIDVTNNGDGTYSFTMPTEGYDVYVTAVFHQATVTLPAGPFTYAGSPITPAPTVECNGATLASGTDYTVGYTGNVNVGTNTATATVTGKGKYFGTATATFSINKVAITIKAKDQTVTYGTAISSATDQVTVTVGALQGDVISSITLTPSTNNVTTSGTITPSAVVITKDGNNMTGNYDITYDKTGKLTINPKEVGLTWSTPTSFTYDGNSHAPTATVKAEDLCGTDICTVTAYTIDAQAGSSLTGGKAVNVGNYTVTATALSNTNYKLPATASTNFSIGTSNMEGDVSASDWSGTYDGTAHTITVTAPTGATVKYRTASSGSYDLETNPGFTNVGNYTVYYEVSKAGFANVYGNKTVDISQKEVGLTWSTPTSFTYTGSAQAPTATVNSADLCGTDACTVTAYTIAAQTGSSLTGDKAVNVGNYTATATTLSNANYKLPATASTNFSITEASMTDDVSATGWSGTYDGAAHTITMTVPTGSTVKYRTASSGSYDLETNPEFTNVGNYTIYYEVKKAGHATAYGSATVNISEKEVGLTWSPDPATFIYTCSAQAPTATVKAEDLCGTDVCTVTGYTIAAQSGSSLTEGAAVNVGNYTATATALSNANYKLPTAASTNFSITALALTIKANDQTVTYGTDIASTKDKVTVTVGALQGADVLAAITLTPSTTNATTNGTITPSAAIIKNGDTDVTSNYAITYDTTGKLTINKAAITIKASDQTVTFGTDIARTTDKVTVTVGALQGADALSAITLTPSTTNATTNGSITPSAAIIKNGDTEVTSNYAITYDKGALTIYPKALVEGAGGSLNITLIPASTVYNGNAQEPTITVKDGDTPLALGTDYTVTYKLGTDDVTEMRNANVYTVVIANKTGGNYSFSVNKSFEITKAAATVTITGHNNTTTFDGAEHSVTGYDVSISNPLYKEEYFTFSGTATAKRTDEGTTNMGLDASQFTNISPNFDPVTFNVTDGYQTITSLTDVVVTITGHYNTSDYDGKEHSVSGYDVSISNPLYKEEYFTFTGTASAARTDIGTTNMGLDASQFINNSPDFTSVTFNVTDGYQTITSASAVVVTITGHYSTTVYDGTAHNVSGYDVSISNPLYQETDFTFSGTASATRTDAGTTDMGLAVSQFTNTNTNFGTVTFNVTDGYVTITPAELTVTADAIEKAAGTDSPALTYGVTGLKGSDTKETVMTGTLNRADGEAVGTYAIDQGTLTANANYTINFIGANFVIYRALDGLFVDGNAWATFVAEEDLAVPVGLEAYVVSSVSGTTVNTEAAAFIAKGVGILLKRTDKTVNSYRGYAYDGTEEAPESLLEGSATADTDILIYMDYILYNDQFELAGINTVGKGRAYLPLRVIGGEAAGSRCLSINGNGIVGIDAVVGDDSSEGNWYDLNGRKFSGKPTKKGLYIKDGRKVVIK